MEFNYTDLKEMRKYAKEMETACSGICPWGVDVEAKDEEGEKKWAKRIEVIGHLMGA